METYEDFVDCIADYIVEQTGQEWDGNFPFHIQSTEDYNWDDDLEYIDRDEFGFYASLKSGASLRLRSDGNIHCDM